MVTLCLVCNAAQCLQNMVCEIFALTEPCVTLPVTSALGESDLCGTLEPAWCATALPSLGWELHSYSGSQAVWAGPRPCVPVSHDVTCDHVWPMVKLKWCLREPFLASFVVVLTLHVAALWNAVMSELGATTAMFQQLRCYVKPRLGWTDHCETCLDFKLSMEINFDFVADERVRVT